MAVVLLIVLLVIAALILGGLNRDFLNRQSRPGEDWSRDPTGNIPPVDASFDKPSGENELL